MLSNSLRPHIQLGGDPAPQSGGESTASMLAAYTAGLPDLMRVTNAQILPNELAQLAASQRVSPEMAALQTQIYGTSGRELNRIGNEIAQENALASASRDADVMAGPGAALIEAANQAQRKIDPEYYKLREQSANALGQMFQPMGGGEREEIQRYLNRQNIGSGNFGVPSMTNVVGNAQTFGSASRDRLGQAIGMATSAIPGMRSGVDVFQQATGKPSFPNTGDARFMGAQQGAGQQAFGMGQGFLQQAGENQRLSQNINANRRDSLDRFNTTFGAVTSGIGNVCCFIFLESLNGQLPWWVRKHRDMYYHAEPAIAAGYKKMAKWLVPLMQKSPFVKSLVNELLVSPIVNYGAYKEHLTTNGSQYAVINNFWLKVWKIYGSI